MIEYKHMEILKPKEVMQELEISYPTFLKLVKKGELKVVNISPSDIRPRYRILRTELDRFLNK
jgi:excisionase family DNA binding protein